MSKCTEGLWTIRPGQWSYDIAGEDGWLVASTHAIPGMKAGEQRANACLIASSPKLLATVIQCRERFAEYVTIHTSKIPPDSAKAQRNQEMVDLCDMALAEAGETP